VAHGLLYEPFMGRRWALAALAMGFLYPAVATAQDEEPRSSSGGSARALTLREVVALATKSNPDAIAAQARIDRAEADGSLATARYLPSVDAKVIGGANAVQDTLIFRNDHYTMSTTHAEGRVDLRWTLYDFGRTSNAVAAAGASTESAEHSSKATKATIAQRAAQLYVTVAFDQNIVASKRTAVKHRTRFAAIARALVDKGVRPAIDETRANVLLQAARHDLTMAEARLQIDRARLAMVAGVEVSQVERVAAPLLPSVDDDLGKAVERSERARPDVAAAVSDVEASDHRVDSARAGWLPRIGVDAGASYRFTRRDFDDLTVPRREAIAMVTVTVPIFEPTVGAQVDAARADLAVAHAREERTRRQAKLEATEATLGLKAAKAALARAKDLESAASSALTVIEARYASGLATPLELVDAETQDNDARETLMAAELRLHLATVDVLVSTGRAKALEGS
jgi:outer membrane protein TolC